MNVKARKAGNNSQYESCGMIERFYLNINGRIDNGSKSIAACCEGISDVPAVAFDGEPREMLENFKRMRSRVIEESKRKIQQKRLFTAGCEKCANFQQGEWRENDLITYVNLSMYPALCQCKCIYCSVPDDYKTYNKKTATDYYEKLFTMLEYAQSDGLIAPGATWQVSSGEISIHPYKERILEFVKGQSVAFYTNCFKFDEKIAANLAACPASAINLSIDSGTAETWRKVKGVDNFEEVVDNLIRYFQSSSRPGQISLKYIVLPGINDNFEDYRKVIAIMKALRVRHLTIARDVKMKYGKDDEVRNKLIVASAFLAGMLYRSDMTCSMFTFAPDERMQVNAMANKLIESGKI